MKVYVDWQSFSLSGCEGDGLLCILVIALPTANASAHQLEKIISGGVVKAVLNVT